LSRGEALIGENDCQSCHKVAGKSIGPSYLEIGQRYAEDDNALEYLTGKIIAGGGGVWGENAMAAHPDLAADEAADMVRYIMNLAKEDEDRLPLRGEYLATLPEGDPGKGVFILRAAYQDKGADELPSLSTEKTLVLRNSFIDPHGFDDFNDVQKLSFGGRNLLLPGAAGSFVTLKDVSLAGVSGLTVMASAPRPMVNAVGGTVELRLGAPDGELLGTSSVLEPSDQPPGPTSPPAMLQVPVQLPSGVSPTEMQDLYLVFNPLDGADGTIMIVMGIQVQLSSGTPTK